MGCDIHAHLEIKRVPYNNLSMKKEWMHVGKLEINAYYDLFRALGTRFRGEGKILFSKKGLPSDITKETQSNYSYWMEDSHTESYITVKELFEVEDERLIELKKLMSTLRGLVLDEHIRLVYWFDN